MIAEINFFRDIFDDLGRKLPPSIEIMVHEKMVPDLGDSVHFIIIEQLHLKFRKR